MNREKIQISEGINIIDLTDKKFKTMKISVNFIMPMKSETASAFSLIVGLLTQSTKEYPSITALSKRLSELYGADLTASAARYGDCQMLNISSSGIADRFALDNENLTETFAELITKALFAPCHDENGYFQEENFEQERRQILEAIESDFNDKRTYAINKCRSQMFKGEPAEIKRYGSEDDVKNLDRLEMNRYLKEILDTARIEIMVLGDCNFETVVNTFKTAFNFERKPATLSTAPTKITRDLIIEEEEQKLSQSKLVLGFKFACENIDQNVLKLLSMVLGGSPSSKFFLNVREKLSLCYYCAAGPDAQKNAFFVDSGVETVNIEKAKDAILKEIEDVKNAVITDDELTFAKLDITNSYKSLGDTLAGIEAWNLRQVLSNEFISVEDSIIAINSVTKEQIVSLANELRLDTVFILKGVQNNG